MARVNETEHEHAMTDATMHHPTPTRSGRLRAMAWAAIALAALAGCRSGPERPSIETTEARAERVEMADELVREAGEKRRRDKPEEAERLYRNAIGIAPDYAVAWNELGLLYLELEDPIRARTCFQRAAETDLRDPRPLFNLGLMLQNVGWHRLALERYREALIREPNHVESVRGAVFTSKALGRADFATLELLDRGIRIDGDQAWVREYRREKLRIESQMRDADRAETAPDLARRTPD